MTALCSKCHREIPSCALLISWAGLVYCWPCLNADDDALDAARPS